MKYLFYLSCIIVLLIILLADRIFRSIAIVAVLLYHLKITKKEVKEIYGNVFFLFPFMEYEMETKRFKKGITWLLNKFRIL